ncbi:MAG: aldose 1-epimerase family protein [Anaerocolumna sp.]
MLIVIENENVKGTVDTFGGELIGLTDGNIDYLWSGDEKFWIGRSPHLFPVIGTLKNNELATENQIYNIGKHGFLRNCKFSIYKKTNDSVILYFKCNEETRKMYPYDFTFYVTHSLTQKGVVTSYKVVNEDNKDIFFNLGGHVGVKCPLLLGETFGDYEINFSKPLTNGVYFPEDDDPIKRESIVPFFHDCSRFHLSHDYFSKGPMIIDGIEAKSLILKSNKSSIGIKFTYEDFPVLALWTFGNKKAPYICLEPWHGLPAMEDDHKEFSKKIYIIKLKPGESKRITYKIDIIKSKCCV